MKNTKRSHRLLSFVLCLVLVLPAFVFPATAEDTATDTTGPVTYWNHDFTSDKAISGSNLTTWLQNSENGSPFKLVKDNSEDTLNDVWSVSDGVLKVNATGLGNHIGSIIPNDSDNTFLDLIYMKKTGAADSYSLSFDFKMESLPTYDANSQKTFSYEGDDGETVEYTISTRDRGESFFTMYGSSQFLWLFKISSSGYMYAFNHARTITLDTSEVYSTYAGENLVVTQKVGSETTITNEPLTETIWNEIKDNNATSGGATSVTIDSCADYDSAYRVEVGVTYTIRVDFSASGDTSKPVKADVYVGEKNTEDGRVGGMIHIGAQSYGPSATNAAKNYIRINEGRSQFSIDNMKIVYGGTHTHTLTASGVCSCGESFVSTPLPSNFEFMTLSTGTAPTSMVDVANDPYLGSKSSSGRYLYIRDTSSTLSSAPFELTLDVCFGNGDYELDFDGRMNTTAEKGFNTFLALAHGSDNTLYGGPYIRVLGMDLDGDNLFDKYYLIETGTPRTKTITRVVALADGVEGAVQSETATFSGDYDADTETLQYAALVSSTYVDSEDGTKRTYTIKERYLSNVGYFLELDAGEWVELKICVDPIKQTMDFYAGGTLVKQVKTAISYRDSLMIRIGEGFNKHQRYNWGFDNVSLQAYHTDYFSENFSDSTNMVLGSTVLPGVYDAGGVTITPVTDSETSALRYAKVTMSGDRWVNFCLTDSVAGITATAGKKYAVTQTIAVPNDTAVTGAVLRISKYHDSYAQASPIWVDNEGDDAGYYAQYQTEAGTAQVRADLYDANGNRLNPWTTMENGVPQSFSKLCVIVDEEKDTFSVYVNDQVAYIDAEGKTPAIDLGLRVAGRVDDGSGSYKTDYTKPYSHYTKELFDSMTVTEALKKQYGFTSNVKSYEYIRVLRNVSEMYIKDITVTLLDDEIEMLGVQERVNAENSEAFDVRFLFAVDNIYVDNIGYYVSVADGAGNVLKEEALFTNGNVFSTIRSTLPDRTVLTEYARNFEQGKYFSAFNIRGIPMGGEMDQYVFTVKPIFREYDPKAGHAVDGTPTVAYTVTYNSDGTFVSIAESAIE